MADPLASPGLSPSVEELIATARIYTVCRVGPDIACRIGDRPVRLWCTSCLMSRLCDELNDAAALGRERAQLRAALAAEDVKRVVLSVEQHFRTFGGSRKGDGMNPLTHWQEGKPAMFAAGVSVDSVVAFVMAEMRDLAAQGGSDGV